MKHNASKYRINREFKHYIIISRLLNMYVTCMIKVIRNHENMHKLC